MIDSPVLLADLKRVLKWLEDDLRARAEDDTTEWGARLRDEHRRAQARERTGMPWIRWRDGEVSQAAVAWIIATVFIRFAEDNGLLAGAELDGVRASVPWITAPGDGLERAVENEAVFYAASPTRTSRDWLQQAFRTLAALPAGRTLVDPDHSPVWHAPISATAADALLVFFRRTNPDGALVNDFSDPDLGTRFLGDLYQDLSDYAKKTYALLQTPEFVEEFILDQTLTPAIAEFGLTGLKLIDPACGSGHFLLGAFHRLVDKWAEVAPGVERGERVQRALNSIHGVDLNPFAVAIARFRLTVAAIKAAGIRTLVAAPAFDYHLAIGDSLLGGVNPNAGIDLGDEQYFAYNSEDLREYAGILQGGQYHVVVANPPYIQPPDAKLRDKYRTLYSTCHGKYALSVPFMELLFRLAKRPDASGAGYVGQITSNSFMTRAFGKPLVQRFLSGKYTGTTPEQVDLTHVIDAARAYIPGHNTEGTPTVILVGRPRKPALDTVRSVLGFRGESRQPAQPANGPVWREIVDNLDVPGYEGEFVSVRDVPRDVFSVFPWSLSGGAAVEVVTQIESIARGRLGDEVAEVGISVVPGEDGPYQVPAHFGGPTIEVVVGARVRDFVARGVRYLWPYDAELRPRATAAVERWLWPYRTTLRASLYFGKTADQRGREWYEFAFMSAGKYRVPLSIAFPELATHNHFVLDRGGRVFNQKTPVIKLEMDASERNYFQLLGVLNSSTVCFWLKQKTHERGTGQESWEWRYEFTSTRVKEIPLPGDRASGIAARIDELSRRRLDFHPAAAVAQGGVGGLAAARTEWDRIGRELVSLQEELDWRTYVAFGLAEAELAPESEDAPGIDPNERPFEIRLARLVGKGDVSTAWFSRHRRAPITEVSDRLPASYRALTERRLSAIEVNPALRLLERPEYKRRWLGMSWEQLVTEAARAAVLDQLEAPELWRDPAGRPLTRSVAQIADGLRRDDRIRALLAACTGSNDYDMTLELRRLLAGAAVPGLAAHRYRPPGLEKFAAWGVTWEQQRAEDRGERVVAQIAPKYSKADFREESYWLLRSELDVPTERFISFPGSKLRDDDTEVYGWAGWDHGERGLAVARFANDLSRAGASDEQVIPLVGVLLELEPWLKQWHDDIDARSGLSPAAAVGGVTTALLGRLGLGRDQIIGWRPPAPTRGRRSESS